ncbi:MAG: hypothetical protein H6751_08755 [Candidatus Omnitrophica bacterium]|nr:hypothetical protein [Candidatus Omnitrophota bacterium]
MATKPRFSFYLAQWFRQCWDNLGRIFLISVLLFITAAAAWSPMAAYLSWTDEKTLSPLPGFALLLVALTLGCWGMCLGWLALHREADRLLAFEDSGWVDFFRGMKSLAFPSLGYFLLVGGVGGVLVFNAAVYPRMLADHPALRAVALAVTGWMLLFLGMVQVHLTAFLVHQDRPFPVALKRAAKVAIGRPFRSLFLLALQLLTLVLFFPPLCFILPGMVAMANQMSLAILLEEWKDPYEKTPEAMSAGV